MHNATNGKIWMNEIQICEFKWQAIEFREKSWFKLFIFGSTNSSTDSETKLESGELKFLQGQKCKVKDNLCRRSCIN